MGKIALSCIAIDLIQISESASACSQHFRLHARLEHSHPDVLMKYGYNLETMNFELLAT